MRLAKTQFNLYIGAVWSEHFLTIYGIGGHLASHQAPSQNWSVCADVQVDMSYSKIIFLILQLILNILFTLSATARRWYVNVGRASPDVPSDASYQFSSPSSSTSQPFTTAHPSRTHSTPFTSRYLCKYICLVFCQKKLPGRQQKPRLTSLPTIHASFIILCSQNTIIFLCIRKQVRQNKKNIYSSIQTSRPEQTVLTQIRANILWCLIWVYTATHTTL